jgi:hypothetical protein
MSATFRCGDPAGLVGYVYGEGDHAELDAVARHLPGCAACAAEVTAMRDTRAQLTGWRAPDPVGRLVTGLPAAAVAPDPPPAERWWGTPLPAWAQAAAAVVLFAGGLALGGTASGWLVSDAPVASPPAPAATAVSPQALADLEQRLRAEIDALRGSVTAAADADAETLARARSLIAESEARQQQELALRTVDVLRDVDAQRRVDLARLEQAVGEVQGIAGAEAAEQRRLLDYLIRVSQQPR